MSKYGSYAELARSEVLGKDYLVRASARPHSPVLVLAPHGGLIEVGTSEIALLIAGDEHNLFCFEGLKSAGANRDLHITSHRFDHPECVAMAARCELVLSVHGCLGDSTIHVGGLDAAFAGHLATQLSRAGFSVESESRRYPGRHPLNICNRGSRAMGAQLEITFDLRIGRRRAAIARAVRSAIAFCTAAPAADYTRGEPGPSLLGGTP
ncbi:MAG TPA: poly-gamma-glutamate hydrolase family protein [Steroidobacteraceae bacterium]|nr:poly-gamma-glutamate hydrolase family protein [Steroidobacteraceae bacterium]